MIGLNFSFDFIFHFFPFKSSNLVLGENDTVLSNNGLKSFQTFFKSLQVMTYPDTSNTSGRDEQSFLSEFIGYANLAHCGIVSCQLDNCLLNMFFHTVSEHWLSSADLFQGQFSSCIIKFPETIKCVSAVAHYFTGL